jgi:hypothetical protein
LNIGKVRHKCNFTISDTVLQNTSSCRDLGITVSHDLSPTLHINSIVAKAHQRANLILRSFTSHNVSLLVRAYTVYVRPLLEHNTVLWSPHLKKDIEYVENVQRRFTKRLPGFKNLSYRDRLRNLNMQSLELRRIHFDLVMCYKIIFGLIDLKFDEFFELSNSIHTRGHRYKLFKKHNICSARAAFFSNRVINVWNYLPVNVIDFSSLSSFDRTINLIDFSQFLRCF